MYRFAALSSLALLLLHCTPALASEAVPSAFVGGLESNEGAGSSEALSLGQGIILLDSRSGRVELGLQHLDSRRPSPQVFYGTPVGMRPAAGCSSASDLLWSLSCAPTALGDGTGMALARSSPEAALAASWSLGRAHISLLASDSYERSLLVPDAQDLPELLIQPQGLNPQLQSPLAIGVLGGYELGRIGTLQLGAQLARADLLGPYGGERQQASVSLALYHGNLSGFVQGRVESMPVYTGLGLQPSTGGVDIGFSWRMPWQARLSVGARNVVSATSAESTEPPPQRVPYVRYHQDF